MTDWKYFSSTGNISTFIQFSHPKFTGFPHTSLSFSNQIISDTHKFRCSWRSTVFNHHYGISLWTTWSNIQVLFRWRTKLDSRGLLSLYISFLMSAQSYITTTGVIFHTRWREGRGFSETGYAFHQSKASDGDVGGACIPNQCQKVTNSTWHWWWGGRGVR